MEKTKIKLEVRKVGTFSRPVAKVVGSETGDPTSEMSSMRTTISFLAPAPRPLN